MHPIPGLPLERRTFLRRALALAAFTATPLSMFSQQQETGVPYFYPLHAIHTGVEGTVKLYVEVSAEGFASFIRTETSSGHELLDQTAEGMVALWTFKEKLPEAKRKVIVPLEFKLTERTLKDLPAKDRKGRFKQRKPKVFYPYRAQERNLSGKCSTLATVSPDGFAEKALLDKSNPSPILSQCALLFTLLYSFGPNPNSAESGPRLISIPWDFDLRSHPFGLPGSNTSTRSR